jgi:hypothetical protein
MLCFHKLSRAAITYKRGLLLFIHFILAAMNVANNYIYKFTTDHLSKK